MRRSIAYPTHQVFQDSFLSIERIQWTELCLVFIIVVLLLVFDFFYQLADITDFPISPIQFDLQSRIRISLIITGTATPYTPV